MFTLAAQELLRHWGLSEETARSAGLFEIGSAGEIYPGMAPQAALVIPYWTATGELLRYGPQSTPFARVRWLTAQAPRWGKKKGQRYSQPAHSGPQVYLPPLVDWAGTFADASVPMIITEGEAKALVAAQFQFRCLALGGVFSFTTPGGELLPVLADIAWQGRDVFVCYDSDAVSNPQVTAAEARLVDELQGRRGARCHVVRLPSAEDGAKVGLDDYLTAHGADALERLLRAAPALRPIDARVISLNRRYAWIELEGRIWDEQTKLLIQKGDFIKGSTSSSEALVTLDGGKGHEIRVADRWLTHRYARRYGQALFRPGEGPTIETETGPALNMWTGYADTEAGDVSLWLRLNEAVFSSLPPELRDWPLKLMAYKYQHPAEKIPLALILVGGQGTGKTAWSESLGAAFAPHHEPIEPSQLGSAFCGWLEKTLLVTCHEITPQHMRTQIETLKGLVSDLRRPMNEKFRVNRPVNAYASYIFTANQRGVGALANDDRRFFVVDVPNVGQEDIGRQVHDWLAATKAHGLGHFLQHYDLKGWKPPTRAPMTAAKAIASREGMTPIQQLAEEMQTADGNVVLRWLMAAEAINREMELDSNVAKQQRGRAGAQAVGMFQVRDWYTAEELAFMFPTMVEMLTGTKFGDRTGAGAISQELRNCGINYLICSDSPLGFFWRGRRQHYLIVSHVNEWTKPMSQAEFERAMANWPSYAALKRQAA